MCGTRIHQTHKLICRAFRLLHTLKTLSHSHLHGTHTSCARAPALTCPLRARLCARPAQPHALTSPAHNPARPPARALATELIVPVTCAQVYRHQCQRMFLLHTLCYSLSKQVDRCCCSPSICLLSMPPIPGPFAGLSLHIHVWISFCGSVSTSPLHMHG